MSVYLVGLAMVLGAYAFFLYVGRSSQGLRKLAPRTAIITAAAAALAGLALALWPMLFPTAPRPSDANDAQQDLIDPSQISGARTAPLVQGETAPPLTAQGWINGTPHTADARLTVVDIWAFW